jgi:hypothetical protein
MVGREGSGARQQIERVINTVYNQIPLISTQFGRKSYRLKADFHLRLWSEQQAQPLPVDERNKYKQTEDSG